jgi:hypothetical protein
MISESVERESAYIFPRPFGPEADQQKRNGV